jgi:hypothetical protein
LVGPDGTFVDFFTQRLTVDDVVDKISDYVQKEEKKQKK